MLGLAAGMLGWAAGMLAGGAGEAQGAVTVTVTVLGAGQVFCAGGGDTGLLGCGDGAGEGAGFGV